MKKILCAFLLLACTSLAYAQSEKESSIHQSTEDYSRFDGFLLDISMPQLPQLPAFDPSILLMPPKDYSAIFQPDTRWSFGQAYVSFPATFNNGMFSSGQQLQKATYKVNDQMRLSLYGQYTADGKRIPNTNATPWDRDTFVGGMELKFNKNFGMRIEVRNGARNPMNPYP